MSKIITFLFAFISITSFAQSPQSFKYQAVVRDGEGVLLFNHLVTFKSSILATSPNGLVVYSEKQSVSTNEYGVISLNIGTGTLIEGNFNSINWGENDFFLKTEIDINGQENFVFMGTSQIMSVPFALYAEKAKIAISDNDTSAVNELQNLNINGNNISISNGNSIQLPVNNDNDASNEIQNLQVNGNSLTITNGNTIQIPPDSDSNPTNELQTISIVGDSLKISNGNAVFLTGVVDLDANPSNELQILSKNGDTLFISNGNYVIFDEDLDKSPTNELQTLTNTAGTISISNGNTIILADSSATNEIQNLTINGNVISISNGNTIQLPNDEDSNPTNELQNLNLSGNTLSISNGNSVNLPPDSDSNPTNELQNLNLSGNTLSISNGNSVSLPPDNDADPSNEIQNIILNNGNLSLSGGSSTVQLPDSSPTNELQTLSLVGDSLKISNGNSVNIRGNKHFLGEAFEGGIIFHLYIDTMGIEHGLIMSKQDLGIFQFFTSGSSADLLAAKSKWDGQTNTNEIKSYSNLWPSFNCPAVNVCLNFTYTDNYGFFDDWYLPSLNELKILLKNAPLLFHMVDLNEVDLPVSYNYWSSTNQGLYDASMVNFFEDDWSISVYNATMTSNGKVRAIRKF